MQAVRGGVAQVTPGSFKADTGSFRDRGNRVYVGGGEVCRGVDRQTLENWHRVSSTRVFQELLAERKIVETRLRATPPAIDDLQQWVGFLVHERIPFISYPYEWSFDMLKDAALLHLEILERLLHEGWTLKDATGYNIQFVGTRPVFIDVPSFVPHVKGEPWVGYRQFCMNFLFPLMIRAYKDIDYIPLLRSSLEGIDPLIANSILSGATRFRKGVLGHVYLHAKMQRSASIKELEEAKHLTELSGARELKNPRHVVHSFAMIMGTLQGLRRTVKNLRVTDSRTTWGNYDTDHSYATPSLDAKQDFVRRHTMSRQRQLAWDIGANTGTYSRICAENCKYTIAIDGDEKAINRLYSVEKTTARESILPLVMNIGNISPNQGWYGQERKALDSRDKPEMILCLAVVHHIVISSNIPLDQFLNWLRGFDADVIIELVGLDDDMTKMLMRNRVNQYDELAKANFEASLSSRFAVKETLTIKNGQRTVYALAPH